MNLIGALYSASQLIGKTMMVVIDCPVYRVADINDLGDAAKPAYTMKAGTTFVIDSFLLPGPAHTDPVYGITYAARSYPYFTFFGAGNEYFAIMIVNGRFSNSVLQAQGTLTVQEEITKAQAEAKEGTFSFGNLFGSGGLFDLTSIKGILLLGIVGYGLFTFGPVIAQRLKKKK